MADLAVDTNASRSSSRAHYHAAHNHAHIPNACKSVSKQQRHQIHALSVSIDEVLDSNPWSSSPSTTSSVSLGCASRVLAMPEVPPLPHQRQPDMDSMYSHSSSRRLIRTLKELSSAKKHLQLSQTERGARRSHVLTADVVHKEVRGERERFMNDMSRQIEKILAQRGEFVTRLQKETVSGQLAVEAGFQTHVASLIIAASQQLPLLARTTDNIEWSREFSLDDKKLRRALGSAAALQAKYMAHYQALCKLRTELDRIRQSTEAVPPKG